MNLLEISKELEKDEQLGITGFDDRIRTFRISAWKQDPHNNTTHHVDVVVAEEQVTWNDEEEGVIADLLASVRRMKEEYNPDIKDDNSNINITEM